MQSHSPSLLPPSARRFREFSAGLFVGARDYEDPALRQVPYAVDDAVDLAYLFALELQLIDPAKTILLISGEPQKEGRGTGFAHSWRPASRRNSRRFARSTPRSLGSVN